MPCAPERFDHRPVGDGLLDRRRELVAEEVVHAAHGTHGIGDELPVVHVVEAVVADAGARGDRLLDADAQVVRHLAPEPVQVEPAGASSGKMVDTRLAHDGTAFTGSRCVITNRTSG